MRRIITIQREWRKIFSDNTMPDEQKLLLTMAEAAKLLSVSERTIARPLKRGELPIVRIGPRGVIFSESSSQQFNGDY